MLGIIRTSEALEYSDIEWAYRTMLGRDPENTPDLLERWREQVPDLRTLMDCLSRSDEFRQSRTLSPGYFSYDVDVSTQDLILPIARRLSPYQVEGFPPVRIGNQTGDGGYVMIDDFGPVSKAYSLGIGGDVSWDTEIADKGIDVYQYDHTIEALPRQHQRFHWQKLGIEGRASNDPLLDTLENQIAANGHAHDQNMLLKCDIENAEWEALAEIGEGTLKQFRQILIELHFLHSLVNREFAALATKAIGKLAASHRVIHVHANNCGAYSIIGGIPLPSLLELTLVRIEDGKVFHPSDTCFPTELDRPTLSDRADYKLGTFRF